MAPRDSGFVQNVLRNMQWVIRIRWIIIACILGASLLVLTITPVRFLWVLFFITLMAGYNLAVTIHYDFFVKREQTIDLRSAQLILNLQFAIDLFIIAVAIYVTGGVESKLVPLYLVYLPMIGLALPRSHTIYQTTIAFVLLTIIFWLPYLGILPHITISPQEETAIIPNASFIGHTLIMQGVFLYLEAFIVGFTGAQMNRLLVSERTSRQRSEALQQMAADMSSSMELGVNLNQVLDYLKQIVEYDYAAIIRFTGDALQVVATRGIPDDSSFERSLPHEVILLFTTILKNRRAMMVSEDDTACNFLKLIYPVRLRSSICAPLVARDKIVGVLSVGSDQPGQYNDHDLTLVQTFANNASLALENSRLYSEIREMALTDSLTGLYNRRHFNIVLEQELFNHQAQKHSFALIIFDIDHFKNFNDTYGHLAGDDALRELGALVRKTIRTADTAFRYGGEEFTVIVPESKYNEALVLCERLRRAVHQHAFQITGRQEPAYFTISLGVALYPEDETSPLNLINAADMALLHAKETRNRTCTVSRGCIEVR